jgi:glutamate dehydrogenase/leucine dehydrogenase
MVFVRRKEQNGKSGANNILGTALGTRREIFQSGEARLKSRSATVSRHPERVIIGGTGLIGSKTVAILRQAGHEVVAGSPKSGINSITGEALKEAMVGAQVVIDLTNSPSFEDKAVLELVEASGRNLLPAEAAAGVRHHVALSIVGTDRSDSGYFRAKVAQGK